MKIQHTLLLCALLTPLCNAMQENKKSPLSERYTTISKNNYLKKRNKSFLKCVLISALAITGIVSDIKSGQYAGQRVFTYEPYQSCNGTALPQENPYCDYRFMISYGEKCSIENNHYTLNDNDILNNNNACECNGEPPCIIIEEKCGVVNNDNMDTEMGSSFTRLPLFFIWLSSFLINNVPKIAGGAC